jgi:hypothetical protein
MGTWPGTQSALQANTEGDNRSMQTSLAQMVALTCHGNAIIHGSHPPPFFPANSTCQFCESIQFTVGGRSQSGEPIAIPFARSPDEWIQGLQRRGLLGFRLHQRAQNHPQISDRNSSAFVGGGRIWRIEAVRKGSSSEFWLGKWEVGDRNAHDRRIWRITYGLDEVSVTGPMPLRLLEEIIADLRASLIEIRAFAAQNNRANFTPSFDQALESLENPEADIGFHKDLFIPGTLAASAESLLKAAQSAWVFGGMGSWNDMGFSGDLQSEYERVSDMLFNLLNVAVDAAATGSMTS